MERAQLHYRICPGRFSHGDIPLCDVVLIGRDRRAVVPAVIDSGATHPIFSRMNAEDAGIDLSRAKPFPMQFGGNAVVGKIIRVPIEIVGITERRLNPEVVFVDALEMGYGLLGRRGIFAQFNEVTFAEKIRPGRVIFRW